MGAILSNATMVGICFTDSHVEMLYKRLEQCVFQQYQDADSPLHEPALMGLLGKGKKPKAKAKSTARKRKTPKGDDGEQAGEEEPEEDAGEEMEEEGIEQEEEDEEEPEEDEEEDDEEEDDEASFVRLFSIAIMPEVPNRL